MIRALWFLIKIGILAAIAVWVAERPGTVVIDWLDYKLTVHVGFFLLCLLAAILLSLFLYRILKGVADLPKDLRRYAQHRRQEKGYRALTLGLTAVAAGDGRSAAYQAHRARKFMNNDNGLPLLLEAQAARLQGREEEARKSFTALLESKDAGFFGVRGLLQAALDMKDYPRALELAREALRLHPKQPWILRIVYDLELREEQWDAALKTLYRAEKAGAIPKDRAASDRVAMLLAQADHDLEGGFREEAFKKLKKAHSYDPAFVPTVLRLGKFYIQRRKRKDAVRIIEKAWKENPHPELATLWDEALPPGRAGDAAARVHWYERLLALKSDSAEGQMAAAKAALEAGLWGEARNYLKMAEKIRPGPRLYKLWAALEQKSGGDERAVQLWLEKAADAPPERAWICKETGRVYAAWAPVAEPHGAFNSMVWDYPGAAPGGTAALPPGMQKTPGLMLDAPKA